MKWKYLIATIFIAGLNPDLSIGALAKADQPHHVLTFFVRDLEKKPFAVPKNPFIGINKKIIKENTRTKIPKSIFALYHGYIALSDDLGQITFPRQTHKTNFKVLITDKIEPVFMFPNTISHWEIPHDTPAKIFNIERKEDPTFSLRQGFDRQVAESAVYPEQGRRGGHGKKLSYWRVESGQAPKDKRIPLETMIIIAKPKNVIYPTGDFITTNLPQLVLPEIYIKKGFDSVSHALFVLQIKKLFGAVNFVYEIKQIGHSKLVR